MHVQERIGEKTTLEILQEEEECCRPVWRVQMHSTKMNTMHNLRAKNWSGWQLCDRAGETGVQQPVMKQLEREHGVSPYWSPVGLWLLVVAHGPSRS